MSDESNPYRATEVTRHDRIARAEPWMFCLPRAWAVAFGAWLVGVVFLTLIDPLLWYPARMIYDTSQLRYLNPLAFHLQVINLLLAVSIGVIRLRRLRRTSRR